MKIQMYGLSHIGKVRQNNEDAMYYDEKLGISVVCDGIGGLAGGEIASQITVETMRKAMSSFSTEKRRPEDFLKDQAKTINSLILQKGKEQSSISGMGTTMECALFKDQDLYLGHIGDSRTYLFFQNQLWQLTVDHNVKTLSEYGDIPKEFSNLTNGDSLIRAFGIENDPELEIYTMKLRPDFILISASDGLFDMVSDAEIASIVRKYDRNVQAMAEALVQEACAQGGVDNVSVVVTRID